MNGGAEDLGCRVEQTGAAPLRRWVPQSAFVLFVVGFWTAGSYVATVPASDEFDEVAEFDVWVVLIGVVGGMRWPPLCSS